MKHHLEWKYSEEAEALYTRFFTRIDDAANWNAGRRFLYSLVLKLSTIAKTTGKPLFSQTFFSCALDGEIDTDLDKIVTRCGASSKQVIEWKREGKL